MARRRRRRVPLPLRVQIGLPRGEQPSQYRSGLPSRGSVTHQVIRSASPPQEDPPIAVHPNPVPSYLPTSPCPSSGIAGAVGPEAAQGKPRLFPTVPAGFPFPYPNRLRASRYLAHSPHGRRSSIRFLFVGTAFRLRLPPCAAGGHLGRGRASGGPEHHVGRWVRRRPQDAGACRPARPDRPQHPVASGSGSCGPLHAARYSDALRSHGAHPRVSPVP